MKRDSFTVKNIPFNFFNSILELSKNLSITNTTGGTLAIDTLVYYSASDGDTDSLKIDNAVTNGGKFTLHGKAGQNYTCQAWVLKPLMK